MLSFKSIITLSLILILFCYDSNKVTSLVYSNTSQQLISAAEDCMIIAWNMNTKRNEVIIDHFNYISVLLKKVIQTFH